MEYETQPFGFTALFHNFLLLKIHKNIIGIYGCVCDMIKFINILKSRIAGRGCHLLFREVLSGTKERIL